MKALLKKLSPFFLSLNVFNNILHVDKYFMQNDNNKMSKCLIKFVLTHRFICYVKWARHASLRNIYQVHHVVVCVVRTNIELNKDILSTIILFAKFGDKTLISLKFRTIDGFLLHLIVHLN